MMNKPDVPATASLGGGGGTDGPDGGGGRPGSGGGPGGGGGDGDEFPARKKVSNSQLLTLIYAAVVVGGGVTGYMKSGSTKSLTSGLVTGAGLLYVFSLLPTSPTRASFIGLALSGALLYVMGSRYAKSRKMMPAGVISLISFIMAGGYVHGIARSSHAT